MSESHSPTDCPKCRRIDNVAKVTAIVQGGTHQINGQVPVSYTTHDSNGSHTGTSYEGYNAVQQSRLARSLTPTAPRMPDHMRQGAVMKFIGNGFQFLLSVFFTLMSLVVVVSAFPIKDFKESIFSFFGGLLVAAFVIVMYIDSKKGEKLSRERYLESMKKWEYSISRWNQLYYCSRDDCIFFPEENTAFPISELNNVIDWHPPEPVSFWKKLTG